MTTDAFLFWLLALVVTMSGLGVVILSNPIYAALSLVMTMVGVAALFVTLNAYFLAGVQLIVYAGAVMVLFVMVLMLFDLRHEIYAFSKGQVSGALKLIAVGLLSGLLVGGIVMSALPFVSPEIMNQMSSSNPTPHSGMDSTKNLGQMLFTDYVFGFQALGILLLVVAVGTVALARSKGGTHAKH